MGFSVISKKSWLKNIVRHFFLDAFQTKLPKHISEQDWEDKEDELLFNIPLVFGDFQRVSIKDAHKWVNYLFCTIKLWILKDVGSCLGTLVVPSASSYMSYKEKLGLLFTTYKQFWKLVYIHKSTERWAVNQVSDIYLVQIFDGDSAFKPGIKHYTKRLFINKDSSYAMQNERCSRKSKQNHN